MVEVRVRPGRVRATASAADRAVVSRVPSSGAGFGRGRGADSATVRCMDEEVRPSTRALAEEWAAEGRDPVRIELVNLLRRAVEATTTEPDRVLADHGLSRGQFDVLAALHRAGPDPHLTQAELAQRMMVTPAGMKKRLDGLYERGIIERAADAADARRLVIGLTADGAALVAEVLDRFFGAERVATDVLHEDDRVALVRLLRRFIGDPA